MTKTLLQPAWERAQGDLFQDVGDFHRKFDLPSFPEVGPAFIDGSAFEFRYKFLEEELAELLEAYNDRDLAKVLDALVDLVYVALGTAHLFGLPFNEAWAAVQRANLQKERAASASDPRSKRGHQLDVVKPAGWQPPDIGAVIRAAVAKRANQP